MLEFAIGIYGRVGPFMLYSYIRLDTNFKWNIIVWFPYTMLLYSSQLKLVRTTNLRIKGLHVTVFLSITGGTDLPMSSAVPTDCTAQLNLLK